MLLYVTMYIPGENGKVLLEKKQYDFGGTLNQKIMHSHHTAATHLNVNANLACEAAKFLLSELDV